MSWIPSRGKNADPVIIALLVRLSADAQAGSPDQFIENI